MNKLVVAISSRALFQLDESHAIFESQGVAAYCAHQRENEHVVLEPGPAFNLARKLLALNQGAPAAPLRIFNSIEHYQLDIKRAAFCSGASTHRYVEAFGAQLFLSTNPDDVRESLAQGHAAATILPSHREDASGQLRIAFDGDAVLFSDDSERIYKQLGLDAFARNEREAARDPMPGGPFKKFLAALHGIQAAYGADNAPIRTALVTARSAPAHERVIRTLRAWDIRIDEALFLGGMPKGAFLKAFGADIFFDDQAMHCDSAREFVPTGHVPYGIANAAVSGEN